MENQLSHNPRQELDRFCRQYLQLQLELDFPSGSNLRNDVFQQAIYARLFANGAVEHPPPARYQLRIMKELTKRIEQSIQDWEEEGISDDLMNCFSSLFAAPIPSDATSAQQKSYVTYTISSLRSQRHVPTITLLEARNLLAASGTTGLRTWEAALHLGNFLCSNADGLIRDKSVLELGAGTGYVSILCAKYLGASHVLATDGSDDVVASLSTNYYLNGLQDSVVIEGKELKWGQALIGGEQPEWNRGRHVDLVLGADLTYDSSNSLALIATFGDLFQLHPNIRIIIAATVRNSKTFDSFLEICRKRSLVVEEIKFEILQRDEQEGPFYEDQVPIQICLIMKS